MFPRLLVKWRRILRQTLTFLVLVMFGHFLFFQIIYPEHLRLVGLKINNERPMGSRGDDVNEIGDVTRAVMTSGGVNHSEKIDWNDYSLMAKDKLRTGPGEQGRPVIFPELSIDDKKMTESLYDKHKFNVFVSNKISLHRSIGDQRDEMCRKANFSKHIPENSVSIIIPFYNEPNSTILRTVFSILNRTPPKLLREIVLVDDFSSLPELKSPLDEYLSKMGLVNKVRVLRNEKRLGLISSRVAGADASTGKFLVFLDSHMEVNYNFLPPLIEPVLLDSKSVTCPVVDNINRHDFRVLGIEYERNGFQWNMQNEHFRIFPKDGRDLPSPYPTPVMMGGAFAIDRKWWETLGKYDPGLEVWGGEQYEISFKIWMCGGSLLNVPCSRVAHVFRHQLPYPVGSKYSRNLKRVASVWMDEYRNYVYQRLPEVKYIDPGDLTSRLTLRERLNCKNFEWYMKNIAVDVLHNYPVIEPPRFAWGALRPRANLDHCVKFSPQDQTRDTVFVDKSCKRGSTDFKFELSWRKTIQEINGIRCFETRSREVVSVHYFRLNATVQQFVWDRQAGWVVSVESGFCLHYDRDKFSVDMRDCGIDSVLDSHDGGGVGGGRNGGGGDRGIGGNGDVRGGVGVGGGSDRASFYWQFDEFDSELVDQEWEKFRRKRKMSLKN